MKIYAQSFFVTATFFFFVVLPSWAQHPGESVYKQTCAACHTIGSGKLVGPDLSNVDQRLSEDWIIKFVKSSQAVIKGGDVYANALFKEYNNIPMPDQPNLTDAQIKEVISYIKSNSPASTAGAAPVVSAPVVTGDAQRGQELFVGNMRFENNGPTCNSCHNVNMEGLISGGGLAKDLTQAVSRLTVAGTTGVIAGLAFPQMQLAYANRPLTETEIADVVAFLAHADDIATTQVASAAGASSAGTQMLIGGIGGIAVLLALFSFFWMKRKQRTVNYSIYKRQIKSSY